MLSFSLIAEQIINGIITGSMYALMAVGLSLIWGILDLFNFSHGALYMLGAYTVFYLTASLGINLVVSTFISIGVMFLIGMFMERMIIKRLRPLLEAKAMWAWVTGTIVVTLGFAISAEAFALIVFGPNYKSLSPLLPGVVDFGILQLGKQMLLSFGIAVFLITGLAIFMKFTKVGLAMRAIAQEPQGALLMGINTDLIFPITFGVSAALAGAAGALLAPVYNIYPRVGYIPFGVAFNEVVIGGLGSIMGSIVGGVLLGVIGSLSIIFVPSGWVPVISFVLMIVVLLVRPWGLFGIKEG